MPLSTAAKAALCICPPAVMVGAVTTVPAAKRAVHHLTSRPSPKPVRHATSAPAQSAATTNQADCIPAAPGVVPLVTYASPIPDEPGSGGSGSDTGVGAPGGVLGGSLPVAIAPIATPAPGPDIITTPVPEPATWLMLICGVGGVGATLRLRRRRGRKDRGGGNRANGLGAKAAAGGALWSGSAAVEAGDMAATVAVKSMVASVAGKAMLCVCPVAVVAGSVMAVPPLRQAVSAATAIPAVAPPIATGGTAAMPCIEPTTVPVSATAIEGFPEAVSTVAPTQRLTVTTASSTTG